MKLALSLLCLMVACIEIINHWVVAEELSYEVDSMIGSEDSYLQLKRRKPSLRRPREEKLRRKENICLAILADDFFDAHNVEIVNPNHRSVYKQVKQQHPNIHEEHFKTGYSSEVIKPKFANPYRLREVSVGGKTVREYMFTCLAKNSSSNSIEQYFVSPEYSVLDAQSTFGSIQHPIRFVYAYNHKKEIVVVAMAEKNPAGVRKTMATGANKPTVKPTAKPAAKPTEKSTDEEEEEEEEEEESSYPEDSDRDESESW